MFLFKDGRFIKVRILDYGDYYKASASTKDCSVWNCYGSTREQAKEMALFRLKKALAEVPLE